MLGCLLFSGKAVVDCFWLGHQLLRSRNVDQKGPTGLTGSCGPESNIGVHIKTVLLNTSNMLKLLHQQRKKMMCVMQYTGKWILRTCVQNENIMTFSAKVYISETKRGVETRLKEHKDACIKDFTDKSAIAEHALTEDHPIREGSNLHMNGTRELALQLRRWLPYKKIRGGVRAGRANPTAL